MVSKKSIRELYKWGDTNLHLDFPFKMAKLDPDHTFLDDMDHSYLKYPIKEWHRKKGHLISKVYWTRRITSNDLLNAFRDRLRSYNESPSENNVGETFNVGLTKWSSLDLPKSITDIDSKLNPNDLIRVAKQIQQTALVGRGKLNWLPGDNWGYRPKYETELRPLVEWILQWRVAGHG